MGYVVWLLSVGGWIWTGAFVVAAVVLLAARRGRESKRAATQES